MAEHHQILLSFRRSEEREGAESVDDAGADASDGVWADDPLLLKISVS